MEREHDFPISFQILMNCGDMKKVAIYCRVSTIDQHPENQLKVLRDYVERHTDVNGDKDLEVFDEYIDITSGSKKSRTHLNRLMNDARKHCFKTVVFWKVDRLGRSVQHMLQIVEEWKNLGIDFVVTTLGLDTSTASGRFVFGVLAQTAEFERELTRERTHLAYQRAKEEKRTWGRPKGSKDKTPRKKSGYHVRWKNEFDKRSLNDLKK